MRLILIPHTIFLSKVTNVIAKTHLKFLLEILRNGKHFIELFMYMIMTLNHFYGNAFCLTYPFNFSIITVYAELSYEDIVFQLMKKWFCLKECILGNG